MEVILQSESSECGLACLAMTASYHGNPLGLRELRRRYPLSLKGAPLKRLVAIAGDLRLQCRPLRLELSDLPSSQCPAFCIGTSIITSYWWRFGAIDSPSTIPPRQAHAHGVAGPTFPSRCDANRVRARSCGRALPFPQLPRRPIAACADPSRWPSGGTRSSSAPLTWVRRASRQRFGLKLPKCLAPELRVGIAGRQRVDVDRVAQVIEFDAPKKVDVLPGHR